MGPPSGPPSGDLAALIDQMMADAAVDSALRRGPVPAVLGIPLRTDRAALPAPQRAPPVGDDGAGRQSPPVHGVRHAYRDRERLPRFADQLGVPGGAAADAE